MALRRHTHFTDAAPQKKQPAPDCLLQNRKIVAKTKRFIKCRLLLFHPKAACTNKTPLPKQRDCIRRRAEPLALTFSSGLLTPVPDPLLKITMQGDPPLKWLIIASA